MKLRLSAALIYAAATLGCGVDATEPPDADSPSVNPLAVYGCPPEEISGTTEDEAHRIFCKRCMAYCHVEGAPSAQLTLAPVDLPAQAIGVPSKQLPEMLRIAPGMPEQSYLMHKVRGTHLEEGGEGQRMPASGRYLSEEEVSLLADWIRSL